MIQALTRLWVQSAWKWREQSLQSELQQYRDIQAAQVKRWRDSALLKHAV